MRNILNAQSDKERLENILIVSYEDDSKYIGLNTRLFGIAEALNRRDVHVEIAVPCQSGVSSERVINSDGIIIHRIGMPNFLNYIKIPIITRIMFVVIFAIAVIRYFKHYSKPFQLIQVEQVYSFFGGYFIARKMRCPIVLDDPTMLRRFMDTRFNSFKWLLPALSWFVEKFEHFVFNKATYIFCSSRDSQYYISQQKKDKDNIFLFSNGVDAKKFYVASKSERGKNIFFNCSLPYYQNTAALENVINIISYIDNNPTPGVTFTIVVNDQKLLKKEAEKEQKKTMKTSRL